MHEIGSRDQLLNYVREFVALKISERPELLAAFLVGSVARADPLWSNTTDFDVYLSIQTLHLISNLVCCGTILS